MCPSQRIHPHHNRSSAGSDNEARVSTHRHLRSLAHRSEGCEARSSMPCTYEHAVSIASALSRVRGWPAHRTRGLGVLTSPSHGEDRQFKSGRVHFQNILTVIFRRIIMGNGGPTGHPCHRCDRTPVDMGLRANFLECFCGPCCPEHGFRCKHDFEWVCVDCQNDCWRGDIRRCPPPD